jgi:hypothetical protein
MKHQFEPHKLNQNQIKALKDTIIVSDMAFDVRISRGGIWLPNDNGTGAGIRARWGRVYAVGPEQQDVSVGQWILVSHGRWTRGLDIEDESGKRTIRRVDPEDVLMVSDDAECPEIEAVSDAVHVSKLTMSE